MRGYVVHEDKRFEVLEELLEENGDDVRHTLVDYKNFDYIVLGLKGPDSQLRYQENHQIHRFASQFFSGLKSGCHLYTFMNNNFIKDVAKEFNLNYQLLGINENLVNGNADLTSEAVISYLITHRDSKLKDTRITIFGYGHLAKSLISYLCPFTKKINVVLRKREYDDEISSFGKAFSFDSFDKYLDADILINTVPARIINYELLKNIRNGSLLLDISSFPYGFDLNQALDLGINADILSGLPGKYAFRDAAKLFFHAIMEGNACLKS